MPGLGDPNASLLVIGLAPAAHGGNRTGRVFTGDISGDFLYSALHDHGFANKPISLNRDDGLELLDCYVTAAVRCAPPGNRPTPQEFDHCRNYLVRELALLQSVTVVVALGQLAFRSYLTARRELGQPLPSPLPSFGHSAVYNLRDGPTLIASYHPSQQNTNTGRLTQEMFHSVFTKAREYIG